MKFFYKSVIAFFSFLLVLACSDSPTDPEKNLVERGAYKEVVQLEQYSAETIRNAVEQNDYESPLEFTSDVSVYRIVYYTVDLAGDIVEASGALMLPAEANTSPMLSIQHGTVFEQTSVASEGAFMAAEGMLGVAFASSNYVTILPDYLGYGISDMMHPYVHAKGNANVVIDMLQAVKSWCAENNVNLNDQIFLGGYSEGGYVTMAAQRLIEAEYNTELPLTAVAPAAGPFDLSGFVVDVINGMDYPEPVLAGFLLTAYDEIYNWNLLDEIFVAAFADQMPTLFDGSKSGNDLRNILPDSIGGLIRHQFVEGYRAGDFPEVESAFAENTLLDWSPQTPIHLFHGNADNVVTVQNSLRAYDSLSAKTSATIDITTYEGLGHQAAAEHVYYDIALWFESFR
ncbi:MAG: lipase family protein [Candidatus Marinimicrobia bacterium]|nr:lipase family protein [Candidatus Neomarinimicrobiota bacterium]MCF7828114.1 lipase family protein [Candidatus Neomarinimicrobiota bacterium]MCF7879711.1 lipase family protein [Candidatus Neomarinimicrobiota bacterium]